MARDTILITGATGQQGGAVARSLMRRGEKVRLFTRSRAKAASLEKLGAEVVTGTLTDRHALDAALKGVKKLFLMTTFLEEGLVAEVQQGITASDAAKAAGVEHLVYTSVASANRKTGIPHFDTKLQVEQHIKEIGLPATLLRPTAFMENFSTFFAPSAEGIVRLPLRPETKLQWIALKDIGEFAAEAFLRPSEFIGQAIDLAGDELTMPAATALLSQATRRPVVFQEMPQSEAETSMGHDFALMFRWFNEEGYTVDIPTLGKRWGIPLTTLKQALLEVPWAKPA